MPTLNLGGTERQVLYLIKKLKERNIDFDLFSIESGKLATELKNLQVNIRVFDKKNNRFSKVIGLLQQIYCLSVENKIIIDAFLPLQSIIGMLVKIIKRDQVYLIINRRSETFYRNKNKIISHLDSLASRYADAITVNNEFLVNHYVNIDKVDKRKIYLTRNDIQEFPNIQINKVNKQNENVNIYCTANHYPVKGVRYLILAFAKINQRKNPSNLILIGSGLETKELKSLVNKFNHKNIIFIEDSVNPVEWYKEDSLFVLPSFSEGSSNSLLEAMSFGMACVVSNCKGNKETLQEAGIYFEPGNVDDIYDKIQYLLNDRVARKKFSLLARDGIEKYTRNSLGAEIKLNIYYSSNFI